jgi:hypothetical protein
MEPTNLRGGYERVLPGCSGGRDHLPVENVEGPMLDTRRGFDYGHDGSSRRVPTLPPASDLFGPGVEPRA